MSLLFHRREIARAVAGELPMAQEENLREHLRDCAKCRAYYDRLSALAESLNPGLGAARAQARLFAALDTAKTTAPATATAAAASAAARTRRQPVRRRLMAGAFILAPAAIVLLWVVRSKHPPSPDGTADEITLRGETNGATRDGTASAPAAAVPSILVYASRRTSPTTHGPVRLVSALPGSGEGRVSLADYVQFSVGGLRSPAYVTVVGVDAEGGIHRYVPRSGGAPQPVRTTDTALPLGPSIDLGRGHHPGRLRLVTVFSAQPLDNDALAALTRPDGLRPDTATGDQAGGVRVVTGLLIVEP